MTYKISNQNLVVVMGGHTKPNLGSQRHLPIFVDDEGIEYISYNGLVLQKLSDFKFDFSRRETVNRG
jgi:hypothetical protein